MRFATLLLAACALMLTTALREDADADPEETKAKLESVLKQVQELEEAGKVDGGSPSSFTPSGHSEYKSYQVSGPSAPMSFGSSRGLPTGSSLATSAGSMAHMLGSTDASARGVIGWGHASGLILGSVAAYKAYNKYGTQENLVPPESQTNVLEPMLGNESPSNAAANEAAIEANKNFASGTDFVFLKSKVEKLEDQLTELRSIADKVYNEKDTIAAWQDEVLNPPAETQTPPDVEADVEADVKADDEDNDKDDEDNDKDVDFLGMAAVDAEIDEAGGGVITPTIKERLPGSKAAAPSTTATKVKAVEPTTATKVKAVEPASKVLGEEIIDNSGHKHKVEPTTATKVKAVEPTTATKIKAVEPTTATKVKAVEPASKVLGEEIIDNSGHKHKLHMSKPKHHKKKH